MTLQRRRWLAEDKPAVQERTSLDADGGDAVSLVVLLQAQLLLVQVDRGRVNSGALQVQTYPLAPQPPGETQRGEGSAPLLTLKGFTVVSFNVNVDPSLSFGTHI